MTDDEPSLDERLAMKAFLLGRIATAVKAFPLGNAVVALRRDRDGNPEALHVALPSGIKFRIDVSDWTDEANETWTKEV